MCRQLVTEAVGQPYHARRVGSAARIARPGCRRCTRPVPALLLPRPPQVGYVSILNLPMRRAEAKRKLEATTAAFAQVRNDLAGA